MAIFNNFCKKLLTMIIACFIVSICSFSYSHALDTLLLKSFRQDYFGLLKFPDSTRVTSLAVTSSGKLLSAVWGIGIKSTTDNGAHWKITTAGLTNLYVTKLHIDSNGKVYASSMGGGVHVSSDNGDSWKQISNGITNLDIKTVMVHPSGTIFAGSYGGGVFISNDSGKNWTQTFKGLRYRDVTCLITAEIGYVIAGTYGGGIFMSRDTGKTWMQSNTGVSNKFITDMVMNKIGDIFAATNGRGVIESPNNGISWGEKDSAELAELHASAITINTDRELIVGTTGCGIFYYDNSVYFSWRKSNVPNLGATAMTNDKYGNLYAVMAGMPIMKSIDKGRTWTYIDSIKKTIVLVRSNEKGTVVICSDLNGVNTSTDNGLNWVNYSNKNLYYQDAYIDKDNHIVLATGNGIYESSNNGQSFAQTQFPNDSVVITVASNYKGTVIASTVRIVPANPPAKMEPDIFRNTWKSTDFGVTFDTLIFPFDNGIAEKMIFSPNGRLYATSEDVGLFVSSDDGQNWSRINGIPEKIESIAFNSKNHILCGTSKGFYISTNEGQRWIYNNLGFCDANSYPFISKIIVTEDSVIYASVQYNNYSSKTNYGVWRSSDSGIRWLFMDSSNTASLKNEVVFDSEGNLLMYSSGLLKAANPANLIAPTTISPSNGLSDQNVNPVYKWNKTDKAELYQIEVSWKDDFELILDDATLSDTTYTGTLKFLNNSKYFWHVRSKVHSVVGPWSETKEFTTKLQEPYLLRPTNDSSGVAVEPDLIWFDVADAKYYKVQISSDKDFSKIVYAKDSILLTDQKAGRLSGLTEYWWRAMCYNDISRSEWSVAWKFKTTFGPPDLIKPDSAAMEVANKPVFLWKKANQALKYYIEISNFADFSNAISDSVNGDTTYSNATLDYNKLYYWRVKSQGAIGTSEWSVVWPFTTAIAPPVLVTPASNATAVNLNPVLDWDAVPLADHYHYQVAKDSEFKDIVAEKTIGDTTQSKIGPLDSYTEYFWRAQAKIGERTGLWSEIWKFKANLSKVLLRAPSNNSDLHPLEINMQWFAKAGATYYFLQVSKEENFNDLILSKDSILDISYKYTEFDKSTKYYWRVKVWNNDGASDWSDVWNFTTGTNSPVLRLPENTAVDVPVNIRFVWDQMGGITKYHIQVAKNDIFDSPVTDNQDIPFAEFKAENLEKNYLYYWRVRAYNGTQFNDWSTIWNFTTGSGSSVTDEPILSLEVHPNPFTNEFTISFSTENPGIVRATLIDALGSTVSILGNEYQLPGMHSLKFSDNVPVGAYFIRLECGGKRTMIKLVKIK